VGAQDTGYQWDHPAFISRYRGWNGTTASHDFNWHDAIHSGGGSCGANSPFPCDDNNHGTHTLGTVLGDDGAGNQVGMAPGAQYICARNMDQGDGTPATYIECFEWFLAPYPVGGTPAQGDPSLAPDVTTNSWACPPSEGCNTTSLLLAVQAQRAAGIVTVVAAGNSGSNCSTVRDPPAIYDEVYSIGAHRHTTGSLASFSSRGPVTVDGSGRMKPDIAAPGVGIRSSVPGNSYQSGWSGTSMATPHVAGAVALLLSAHPDLKGQVDLVEQILNDSAVPVSSMSCGSTGVPNNLFGHGRLDAEAAVLSVRTMTAATTTASLSAPPGTTVTFTIDVTNTGHVADTYAVTLLGSTWTATAPSSVGPIPAGQSQPVSIHVTVPALAQLGSNDAVLVDVASQLWSPAAAGLTLTTTAATADPTLALTQPQGPGTGALVSCGGLVPGREYYNIFSFEPCPGGLGTGPYLGLCATDFNDLWNQFLLPAGVEPFHFIATSTTASFGPYLLPAGLDIEGICFDLTGSVLGGSAFAALLIQ
jgi:subtilisin family serine protease